ncbi:MAG: KTSC domain-containing protein [Nannocystaceae bacterium]
MEREPVESTALASVGYDPRRRVLEIEFRSSGKVYEYLDVPETMHAWLMRVPDKGGLFNRMIEGKFEFRRVDAVVPEMPCLEDALRASLAAVPPRSDDEDQP